MDHFLEASGIDKDDTWSFAFVDSIDEYYDEPSEAPMEADSNPNSPYIRKKPQECSQLLSKLLQDTESEIIPCYFIIIDDRSIQDDTVLLVSAVEDWPLLTIRATFQASAQAVVLYLTGHRGMEDDAECAAQEEDNVYRGP